MDKYHVTAIRIMQKKKKNTRQLRVRAGMQKELIKSLVFLFLFKNKKRSSKVTTTETGRVFVSYGDRWKANRWENGGLESEGRDDWTSVKWTGVLSVCFDSLLEIARTYCVVNWLYSLFLDFFLKRKKRNVRKKKQNKTKEQQSIYEISPWTVASNFSVLNKPL